MTLSAYYPQCSVTMRAIWENYGTPKDPLTFHTIPKTATVVINSYNQADSFSIEFDAADFPVTPETLKTGSVEIYLYHTRSIGDARRYVGVDVSDIQEIDGIKPVVVGLFDEMSVEYSDDGRTITIQGQDYTSLLLASRWKEKQRVPRGKRLDKTIRDLLDEVPGASNLNVVTEPSTLVMPVCGASASRTKKNGLTFRSKDSYWDVIYQLAVTHGLVCYVRGLDLVLTQPRSQAASNLDAQKTMIYGRNITSLEASRKMSKETVPIIEVRSYDTKSRKVIAVRYPPDAKTRKHAAKVSGIGTDKEEIRIYTVYGVSDKATLSKFAENAYFLIGRSECEYFIETRDITDIDNKNLLRIQVGDAINVGFEDGSTSLLEVMTGPQRVAYLKQRGYDTEIAQDISEAFDRSKVFKRPLRLKEATFDWSVSEGISISLSLQNFINIAEAGAT